MRGRRLWDDAFEAVDVEEISADLDVVVGELANLVFVHAHFLGVFVGTELAVGYFVEHKAEEGGDDAAVAGDGADVGNLLVHLFPVVVDPAAGVFGVAIVADDVVCSKDGVEEEAEDAGDAVLGEDVQGVVDLEPDFEDGGEVADASREDAEDDGGPEGDDSRCWSCSNESGNDTRAEADGGPVVCAVEVEQDPGESAKGCAEVGVHDGVDAFQGRGHAGEAVEAEPAEPEQHGADGDEGHVVGPEVDHQVLLAGPEEVGDDEARKAGQNLDGAAAGVVEDPPAVCPAGRVPDPACDGAVDKREPAEGEGDEGEDASSFTERADVDACCDGGEHALEVGVRQFRDALWVVGGIDDQGLVEVHVAEVVEVADELVGRGCREREGVAPEVPLEDGDQEDEEDGEDHVECRLAAGESRVEVR